MDNSNPHKTAIGYAEASALGVGSFGGATVDGTAILLRYTLLGDANLDGSVTSADFVELAQNFGKASPVWCAGDFNYDGNVNALDFNALASNYGQSLAQATLIDQQMSLIPEPEVPGALISMIPLIWLRRQRNSTPHA